MRVLSKFDAGARFAWTRLRNARMPIVVRWQTTNRCTARCRYCSIWSSPVEELSTQEAQRMLAEFHGLGMRRLCFSGGEPLLRDDIGELVDFALGLGVSLEMNSNGALLHKHLDTLRKLELTKVSIDGPKEIHDGVRHATLHDRIMDNLELSKAAGVRFSFATTLMRENATIDVVDHMLELAGRFDTFVAFQPVVPTTPWGTRDMDNIGPGPAQMRAVVEHLIAAKKRRGRLIRNSLAALRYIRNWPEFPPVTCTGGRIFVVVESNGDLYACERTFYPPETDFPNVRSGVSHAFESVVFPDCKGCGFCGAQELNSLWNLKLSGWREIVRIVGW